ncbi:hypothetical protein [Bacillus cereus]|uniref:hypothetical protein n=1 Tax=Bacillus cereus TaxID=1396 RepID=UPI00032DC732|nr:hypothetical protein [Bacillus cereus]EOO97717.1 hypothetical protein II1_05629 [Bacillus cereus MC118]
MKLTLFTISNEQIKEQLSKLQTKVESLEYVKDVQDKIISAKDSQISFLNDQIANIWTPITIVAGFIALVFGYVAWLNRQADKKVKQGEEQFSLAQEKIEQAEALIQQSESAATIAQDKLEELEEKQKELNNLATTTIENQKIDMLIRQVSLTLDLSKKIIDEIFKTADLVKSFEIPIGTHADLIRLNNRHASILESYRIISLRFNSDVAKGYKINYDEITDGSNNLRIKSNDLYKECLNIRDELGLQE